MSSQILQHFVSTATARGLVLPRGGGTPGQQVRESAEYARVSASSARMRQYAAEMRSGRTVAGQRLDAAASRADAAADARYAAHVAEWASYLAADPHAPRQHDPRLQGAGQRVDSNSVDAIVAEILGRTDGAGGRTDGLVPMASQGLTAILPDVYMFQHAGLPAWAGEILPVDKTTVPPAAENFTWYEEDNVGVARAGSTYSMKDIPLVAGPAAQANRLMNIVPFLCGMETNFMEGRREALAVRNGKPDFNIDMRKVEMCQRAIAEAVNGLWLYGDPFIGIDGLWTSPDIATINIAAPWSGKTSAGILADLINIFTTIPNSMQGGPTGGLTDLKKVKLTLPPAQFYLVSGQLMSAAGTQSVLSYFLQSYNLPADAVTMQYSFAAANSQIYTGGPNGLSTDHALVTYLAGDQWDPKFMLPQPIEMPAPPKQTGMGETTFYHARAGGMMVADARRMRYVVGM